MDLFISDTTVAEFYTRDGKESTQGNSGYDLHVPGDIVIPPHSVVMINYGIVAVSQRGCGIYLYPRSSISKTPLRLANSVGVIDPSYRGCIIAALENTSDVEYKVSKGDRLVQLCLPDLLPFRVELVSHVSETLRGSGGFGSTGI